MVKRGIAVILIRAAAECLQYQHFWMLCSKNSRQFGLNCELIKNVIRAPDNPGEIP